MPVSTVCSGDDDDVAQVQAAVDDPGRARRCRARRRAAAAAAAHRRCWPDRTPGAPRRASRRRRSRRPRTAPPPARRTRGSGRAPDAGPAARAPPVRAAPTIAARSGWQPDPQHLDHDRPARLRVLSTKHRADAAGTDLVQDAHAPVRSTRARRTGGCPRSVDELLDANCRWGSAHLSTRRHTADRVSGLVDTPQGLCNSSRSVSSPSAPASAAGGLAIDIRQLPWISRLAADYAFAFENLAPFYAGDPRRPDAWAEVIARVHATPRAVPALSSMLLAQLAAREAPARRARGRRRLRASGHRRRAHRPAGRPLRRAALHPAQGADRHQAGPPDQRHPRCDRGAGLLDRLRGSRLGRGAALYGPRRRPGAADRHRGRCRRRR